RIASQVRRDIIRQTFLAQSGHPGGSLGCADFLTALYFKFMKLDTNFQMEGAGEDVFFLSNGHISPLWYSVLARRGFFPVEELATFRKIDSRLQGHPATHEGLPGVRVASGSLGQGLSVAVGMALAKRLRQDPRTVFVLMGDGEQEEGQIWEAVMAAAHYRLDNLIATIDWNGQQIDGPTEQVMALGDLPAKYQAFGWKVLHMNGNDMEDVVRVLQQALDASRQGRPVAIMMRTEMGYPIDFMVGSHKWHGIAPNQEQAERALAQLEETLGDFPAPGSPL
ncbi:MAG: transketolase, partial [Bacteroidetes bacterium]